MKRKFNIFIYFIVVSILSIGAGGCAQQSPDFAYSDTEEITGQTYSENSDTTDTSYSNGYTDKDVDTSTADMHSIPSDDMITEDTTDSPTPFTLVMVGDVLLHTPVEESSLQEDGSYNYDALFAHTRETIQSADLALVNQEVIIGGEELGISGYPAFNASFSLCDTLVSSGFDVVCHATNHVLDKGRRGLVSCYGHWKTTYPEIAVLGIHTEENTSTAHGALPYLYTVESDWDETESFTIAILNYTYGTNGIALPDDMPYAVDLLDEEQVTADIRLAEEIADFTIVCPHWGTEYRLEPDSFQEKWTQIFLENGVDLVLGTHPHVIEPVEWVTDEKSGHQMLVYYSLGNYVNWTSGTGEGVANRMVGGMAEVTITLDEEGNAVISDYGINALVSHVEPGINGVSTYFLSEYTEELAERNAIVSQDASFNREYCVNLCNQVWGDLWE